MTDTDNVWNLPYVMWPQSSGITADSLRAAARMLQGNDVAPDEPLVLAGYHNPDTCQVYVLVKASDYDQHRDMARDDGHLIVRLAG